MSNHFRTLCLCSCALLSMACGGSSPESSGGQTGGEEPPGCNLATESRITLDANTPPPAGFSANELLTQVGQLQKMPFHYQSGTTTKLTLSATSSGPARYGTVCKDLEVPVSLHFVTDDGVFAEAIPMELSASRRDRATGKSRVARSSLQGSFAVAGADTMVQNATSVDFTIGLSATGAEGDVTALEPNNSGPETGSSVGMF